MILKKISTNNAQNNNQFEFFETIQIKLKWINCLRAFGLKTTSAEA